MADFSVNPIAQNLKPATPMSLGEMLNLARSGQAYQQAQQINPLEVQRASAELQRLRQLMPEEYRQKISEANRAETEANVSEKTSAPRITQAGATASSAESTAEQDRLKLMALKQRQIAASQIALINHPLVIEAEKNPTKANVAALENLVNQSGINMGRDLGIKPDETAQLNQPYMDIAKNDPGSLRGYLKQRHIQGLDESARTAALSPSGVGITSGTESQVTSTNPFSETPVGTAVPGTYRKLQLMPNEQLVEDNQGNQFIQSKDNQGRITIRPVNAAPSAAPPPTTAVSPNMPKAVVAPKPSAISQRLATEVPTQTAENLPVHSQPVPPRFPVRVPGQPVFTLQQGEKEAQETGGKFLRESLANRNAIPTFRNNVEKIISTTDQLLQNTISKAGKGLTIEQYFNKLLDDSQYKLLSKQLAQLQIQMSGTPNMSTDAGKTMALAATGDATYPPEVLQKIAIQLHGEMEAKDKLGTAADKYARKFGESNMASFGQMWNNNADAKVFEVMSADKLIKDPKIKEKIINQIIEYPKGSEKRKEYFDKYRNIKKLISEGTL
jgi:hypothetical protein